ncbi:MAG: hypothetical protein V2A76_03015 [Planctomycetota bacterium]
MRELDVMDALSALIGQEQSLADACRELKFWTQHSGAAVIGSMRVTCSDESCLEGEDLFQRSFAQEMLPRLKHGLRSSFRLANPGARYDWGSARVAEANFARAASPHSLKLLLVQLRSHVSFERDGSGYRFGIMRRYGSESPFCGALAALVANRPLAFVEELRALFLSENLDRIAMLQDPACVDPNLVPLFVAMVNARLQARCAVQDLQDHQPESPTLYIVTHGVTINKPGPDSELLCGLYRISRSGGAPADTYEGLGDDPSRYRFELKDGSIHVSEESPGKQRKARDHRDLAAQALGRIKPLPVDADARLNEVRDSLEKHKHHLGPYAKAGLKTLLAALIEIAPVPTALVLLGEGLLEIHHAHRLNQARNLESRHAAARQALLAHNPKLDSLRDDQRGHLMRRLLGAVSPGAR